MDNKYERDVQSIKAYIIKESKNSIESFRFEEISPLQYLSKEEQIKKLNVIINKFYEILNTGYPFVAYNFENSVFNEDNFFNTIPSVLIATEEKINIENLESNKIIKEFITEFVRAKYLEMALIERDLILTLKTENLDLLNSTKTENGIIMYDYLFETNKQNAYTLAEKHNLSEYDRDYIRQNFWPIIKVNSYDVNTIKEKLNNLKVEFVKEYTVFDLEIFNRENTSLLIYEINQYIDILKRGKVRVWDEYGNDKFYIFKMESGIKDDTLIISDKNINHLEIYFKTILKVLEEIPNEQNTIDLLKELDAFEIFNNQFKNEITDLFNKNISKNETLNIYYKDYLPKYLTRINEIISHTEQMESDFKLNFPELKTELQNLNTITSKFKKSILNDLETTLNTVLKIDYERLLFEYLNITNKLETDLKIEGKKISTLFEIFYNRMLHIKSNPKPQRPQNIITENFEVNEFNYKSFFDNIDTISPTQERKIVQKETNNFDVFLLCAFYSEFFSLVCSYKIDRIKFSELDVTFSEDLENNLFLDDNSLLSYIHYRMEKGKLIRKRTNIKFELIEPINLKYFISLYNVLHNLESNILNHATKEQLSSLESKPQQPEPLDLSDTPIDTKITFENKFDKVTEAKIIEYFKKNLVDKNYLTENELNKYLKQAFELRTPPKQKYSFENIDSIENIVSVFYKYYKDVTTESTYGRQTEYFNLLKSYFNGFEKIHIKNFSKQYISIRNLRN